MVRRILTLSTADARADQRADGQPPAIVGYAARYYDPNDPNTEYRIDMGRWGIIVERIAPGAFDRAVNEDDVVGLFNHDANLVLGRKSAGTLHLRLDAKGLHYDINPPASSNVPESIRRGDVKGSSFSFSVRGQKWEEMKIDAKDVVIRTLTDVQLYDVGPVVFPAYGAASTGVRAFDPESLGRELDAWKNKRAIDLLNSPEARQRRAREAEFLQISSAGT